MRSMGDWDRSSDPENSAIGPSSVRLILRLTCNKENGFPSVIHCRSYILYLELQILFPARLICLVAHARTTLLGTLLYWWFWMEIAGCPRCHRRASTSGRTPARFQRLGLPPGFHRASLQPEGARRLQQQAQISARQHLKMRVTNQPMNPRGIFLTLDPLLVC